MPIVDPFDQSSNAPSPQPSSGGGIIDPFDTPQAAVPKNDDSSSIIPQSIRTAGSAIWGAVAPVINKIDKPRNAIAGAITSAANGGSLDDAEDAFSQGWHQTKRYSLGDLAFQNLMDARKNPNKNLMSSALSKEQWLLDKVTGDPAKTDALLATGAGIVGDVGVDPTTYLGVGEGKLLTQAVRAQKLLDAGVDAAKVPASMMSALNKVKASKGLQAADKLTTADTVTQQLWQGDKGLTFMGNKLPGTGKVLAPVAGVLGKTASAIDEGIGKVMPKGVKPSDVLFTDLNNPLKGFQFRDAAQTLDQGNHIATAQSFLDNNLSENTGKLSIYIQKRYGLSKESADQMVLDAIERKKNPSGGGLDFNDPDNPLSQGVSNRALAEPTPTLDEHGNPVQTSMPNQEGAIRPSQGQVLYPNGINYVSPEAHIPGNAADLSIESHVDAANRIHDADGVPRNAEGQVYANGINGDTSLLALKGDQTGIQQAAANRLEAAMQGRRWVQGTQEAHPSGIGLADMAPGRKAARTSADALDTQMRQVATKGKGGGTHEDNVYELDDTPDPDNANVIHEQTNPNPIEDINAAKKTNPKYAKQATGANKLDSAMRGEPVNPRGRPKTSEVPEAPAKPEAIPEPKDEAPKDVKADEQAIAKERVQNVIQNAVGNPDNARIEALRQSIRERIEAYKASGNDKLYSIAHGIEKDILNHPVHGSHIPTLEEAEKALDRRALNKGTGRKAVEKAETPVDAPESHAPVIKEEPKEVPKSKVDPDKAADDIIKKLDEKKASPASVEPEPKPATPKEKAKAVNKAAKEAKAAKSVPKNETAKPDVEAKLEDRAGEATTHDTDNDVARAEGTAKSSKKDINKANARRSLEDRKLAKELGIDIDDPMFDHDDHAEPDEHEAYEKGASAEDRAAAEKVDEARVDELVKSQDVEGIKSELAELNKQIKTVEKNIRLGWRKSTPEGDAALKAAAQRVDELNAAIKKLDNMKKACE